MSNEEIFGGEMMLARAVRHVANRAAKARPANTGEMKIAIGGPEGDACHIINWLIDELDRERRANKRARRRA